VGTENDRISGLDGPDVLEENRPRLIAISTTSGTGSEITPFALPNGWWQPGKCM
jgi:alcohol dehydrogenase class IV